MDDTPPTQIVSPCVNNYEVPKFDFFILVLSNRFYIFVSARFLVFSYSDFGVGEKE